MTSLTETFAGLLSRAETSEDYWLDIAVSDFASDLHARMQRLKVTHKELADRMGTSRPYVTKLLGGGNFTLFTMVKLAMALDAVVRVRIEGNEERAAVRQRVEASGSSEGVVIGIEQRRANKPRVEAAISEDHSDTVSVSWG